MAVKQRAFGIKGQDPVCAAFIQEPTIFIQSTGWVEKKVS
jgi:hypothetical protein